jgi:hypothetical protein
MDIHTIRSFFLWCTIMNGGLLIISFLMCACARDLIHRIHSTWFPLPKETFTAVIYSLLGVYKIAVIAFNLVPYLALVIIG